jgi:hypothetical protein
LLSSESAIPPISPDIEDEEPIKAIIVPKNTNNTSKPLTDPRFLSPKVTNNPKKRIATIQILWRKLPKANCISWEINVKLTFLSR